MPARNSRAPARLLEAAELLESDQRKHEGGQSKKKKKKKEKKKKKKKIKMKEARAELYMQSAHSRIDRPRRLTSN